MAYEFKLPDIGEGVVEGEIVRWLVAEGDVLDQDQPMVEVMTDKATVEIPAPRPGRVLRRMFAEGQTCPVGQVLIAIDDGSAGPAATPAAPTGAMPRIPAAVAATGAPAAGKATADAVSATPAVRKLAAELGVDLATVTGRGPGGRITPDDVRAARDGAGGSAASVGASASHGTGATTASAVAAPVAPPGAAGTADVRIPLRGLRRRIAEHMSRSWREAAHFTYVEEIDCTALVALRAAMNREFAGRGVKLNYLPFFVKVCAAALKLFPQMNALLDEKSGEIVRRGDIHVGIASQTDEGLLVPVVRHADRRTIEEVAREIERLATAARSGKAAREDLTGSTFTITSLGALGGVLATPIVNHPEVAILGVHKIARRPAVVVEDGRETIAIRDLMNLSVSVDHRLVDGADAARFMAAIKAALETPARLRD